jgi:hypothetical protein
MSSDERLPGGRQDENGPGRARAPVSGLRTQQAQRPVPGKVTLASKLPVVSGQAVQRRAPAPAPASVGPASTPQARSAWEQTMDAAMDAAHRGAAAISGPTSILGSPAIQARPADEKTLRDNADKNAAELLRAFQGLGTDDQAVYGVLNQPSGMLRAIVDVYDARYNRHTGKGLVEDLRDEFDHAGSQDDWHFVLGQLMRAGIEVPDAALPYQRQDPAAERQGRAHIQASPDVRVAVPGTRITYTLVGARGSVHSAMSPHRYQWYALNDPVTARLLGKPARVDGGDGPRTEAIARFVGNHKIICKVLPRSGRGDGVPAFYEFPQTVVPEGKLAQDALRQAPEAADPGRQREVLEMFLHVLREAAKQPGSAPLDPEMVRSYEKQIAALRRRLASTEGAERIPIRAVHVDREKARVSPLRAFVARTTAGAGRPGEPGTRETWRLVDITNPESRRLSGEYEGTGRDAREAILAALAAWDTENRYAPGRIQLEVGAEAAGAPIAHTFQTDGMSFWDSIGEFFAEVGFWTGMGALAAGVVTAVVPVPGMHVVSGLIWTSILASTVATTIDLAQRHAEDMSTAREDAMDVLTIAGNILAGAWLGKARVLVNGQGGSKIGTGLLIGQLGTDSAQGIVLGVEYLEQYDRVMAIEDPKQRTEALMELLRSAATAGGMLFLSVQGTRADLGQLGQPGRHGVPGQPDTAAAPRPAEGSQPRALDAPRGGSRRTAQEHAALVAELPPELRGLVDVVESDAVQGTGVRVAYKDGALRIEVGPGAQPRHVRYHVNTARHLLKYQGPLGQIRKLLHAILTKLRLTPGYGTRGFEARQEVAKLLGIQAELETLRARLDGRVRTLEGQGDLSRLDARQIDRELADIQEQLEYHQGFIDSYQPGRGFVAAEGKGRELPEFPVARSALYEKESTTSQEWALSFHAKAPDGTDILWGQASAPLHVSGGEERRPTFVLDARVHRDGVESAMHIYDDVVERTAEGTGQPMTRIGTGKRTSATHYALERMLEAYRKRFGNLPEAIGGSLAEKNKLNFQREYYRALTEQGLPDAEARLAAIRRISFGRHRSAVGYDDFEVKFGPGKWVEVDLGPPYGSQSVPDKITVTARPFVFEPGK